MTLTKSDRWVLLLLLGVGLLTHFVGLAWPTQVVFDEVHFGKFITAYCCTGERFFDIHPPHAKLLIAGAAWLGGYRGGFSFESIGQVYEQVPLFALRFVPALAGVLIPLVLFVVARQIGISSTLATLVGAAAVLDNALTIQTRIIALDGVLLLATFGSISAYLAAQTKAGWQHIALTIVAGVLAGLAVGTKFTGLAALGVLGLLVVRPLFGKVALPVIKRTLSDGVLILLSAVVVYFAGWALHFALLPLPGSGDAFHVPVANPNVVQFFQETIELHQVMLSANYNLTATHPNASPWWSWPLMQTPVFYWTGEGGLQQIYFVGNPVVWWGATLLFVVALLAWIISFGQRQRPFAPLLWVMILGYCIAMFPLVRVPRALFLYHYLTPLYFSVLVGMLWLDSTLAHQRVSPERLWRLSRSVLVALLVGFLVISPFTYGYSLGKTSTTKDRLQRIILFWLPR